VCGTDGSEIITRMEAERERMVWAVWVHTVELADGNENLQVKKKREA